MNQNITPYPVSGKCTCKAVFLEMITMRINKHAGPRMKIPRCKGDNGSPNPSEYGRPFVSVASPDPLVALILVDAPWVFPSPALANLCSEGGQGSQNKATSSEVDGAALGAMASKWAVIRR